MNVLEEERRLSVFVRFLEQLNSPLIYILMAAAAISALLKEYGDMAIILVVITLNSFVGVIQEGKAARALEALKKLSSPKALLKEGERVREVPASSLIPGDIVCLEAGRQVPADLLLKTAVNLKIEEAALTGESVPVEKSVGKDSRAYMSTNVTYGRGEGIVTAIGMETEIGKIAGMLQNTKTEKTPLQKRLADLGKVLSILSIILCVLLFLIAVWQRRDIPEMLITAISLAVAAVPEGLPAIVTMVLALSVSRMVKVNTIVKRLPSVETLGCVSVVCSDKTGTLTQNRMTVARCYTGRGSCGPRELKCDLDRHFLQGFTLCNDAEVLRPGTSPAGSLKGRRAEKGQETTERLGDPTELALLDMAAAHGLYRRELERSMPRRDERPFDSDRKLMTTLHADRGNRISYTKGSPDEVLARCRFVWREGRAVLMGRQDREEIGRVLKEFTGAALRVLAIAMYRDAQAPMEQDLIFVGMAGMYDPVRPEAAEAVAQFRRAGVKTVMITGDRADTAFAIAKELCIADRAEECISGEELSTLSEEALRKRLPWLRVFAHVAPEHKVRIVSAYKKAGEIVAMTGDGVNDAPSLKVADVGVAMGMAGTDVAKNAADLVLTDDNFATITKAIALGRGIYENIKKSVLFLLSSNFGEIITMLAAISLGLPSPLKPSHILWINLITDSLPALALGVDVNGNKNYMKRPPRSKNESLFAKGGLSCTLLYGFLIAFISTAAFLQLPLGNLMRAGLPITVENLGMLMGDGAFLGRCQTYAFTVLGISQLFHAIGMRDVETSLLRMNHRNNKMMLLAVVLGIFLQLLVTEVPYFIGVFGTCSLAFTEWLLLLVLSAMPLLAHEILAFLKNLH
ncbi:MAG: cation-translocating P-type ATPase [Lachnospiraceae bacterium]|nr:cation-translocating P-type ATPase [Lachnospiraceae bacterium]